MALGTTSINRLATCTANIKKIMLLVDKRMAEHGRDHSVFCGHRTEEEQNKAFAGEFSKVKWPDSKHNSMPSTAVDAGPYFVELKNTDWGDRLAFARYAGLVEMVSWELYEKGEIDCVLRWGGDWDMDGRSLDHKWTDLPHFEEYRP